MKTKNFSLVLFVLPLMLIAFLSSSAHSQFTTKVQSEDIDKKLKALSLEQKIGQLFIFGFNGTILNKSTLSLLKRHQPGGIIIFSRNIKSHQQIAALNYGAADLSRQLTGLPLLVMVDQEGGSVTRIKTKPSAPSALALGMTKDLELIRNAGKISGEMMQLLGFNMNLAPVMDLSSPNKKNFIGNRSFGIDPHEVKLMAQAFVDGQSDAGVVPTAKHFPGHGGLLDDSHKTLPIKNDSVDQLAETDLIPFKHFIQHSSPSAIMVAHVAFPNIDPSGVPAAFSSIMINDLLRDRLGYNGLVITDDLEMAGADSIGDAGERAVRALEAGCDMIMVAWSPARQKKAVDAVRAAVKTGRLSSDRIDDSLRRIIQAKLQLHTPKAPGPKLITKRMNSLVSDLKNLTHKVSRSNFQKSADNYPHLKGQARPAQNVIIFSSDNSFLQSFQSVRGSNIKGVTLSPKRADPVETAVKASPDSLFVYYVTGEGTARRLRALSGSVKKKLIVVNSTNPGLIGHEQDFKAVFDIHSQNYQAGRWVAEFLFENELRMPASRSKQADAKRRIKSRSAN